MNTYKSKFRNSKGFTLIEILTVIAIIAILSAILVPTVSQMQSTARKTKDLSNMRQIINASRAYGAQNGDVMVQAGDRVNLTTGLITHNLANATTTTLGEVAAVLAVGADLNDLNIWISDSDNSALDLNGPTPVIVSNKPNPIIDAGVLSFNYVVNLNISAPATTPLIFSRLTGAASATKWSSTDIYQGEGGHMGFAGGNVSWFEDFSNLFDGNGTPVTTISGALSNLPSPNENALVVSNPVAEAPDDED